MSILIKGMEMPKACYDCPCEYDGKCSRCPVEAKLAEALYGE